MFIPGFHDLVKPQWVATLEELKLSGGLPVSELARRVGASYMAVKQHCEDLRKLGYLDRSRVPRTAVGRPEIFYRLSQKADVLFPQAGLPFSLGLLEQVRQLFGESAPERLLYQHFTQQQDRWLPRLQKTVGLTEKASLLASLRTKEGHFARCVADTQSPLRIEEFHHPLQRIFERYPRAVAVEVRLIERLLGTRVIRREIAGGPAGPARVDFEISGPAAS